MRAILAGVAIDLALGSSAADDCTTWTTTDPEVDVLGLYYFVHDSCGPNECMDAYWIYEESNGIAGLQRADEIVDDTCHGMIAPDTVIF